MTETGDAFVPTIGFLLAGLGLASGLLRWTELVAAGPVESVPGVVFGAISLAGFALRRYGASDRRFSLLAGVGSGGLATVAGVTLLHPTATADAGVGIGPPIAFVLGVLGVGVATADYYRLKRRAFLLRSQYATDGLFIGLVGLLTGFVFSMASYVVMPVEGAVASTGIGAVAFSVGLGVVAIGYLRWTERDRSFLDIAMPTRVEWLYVVAGTILMFGILLGAGLLTDYLGIPSAQHGLFEQAQETPLLLLFFVPLSWLVIGPGEELLSRNIIQKHLYDGFSRPAAVLVGTGVFTTIHLPAYATGPPPAVFGTLLQLFGISLVLGIVYERTENVVVPALVHGTYNALQFVVAYVSVTQGIM